MEHTVFTYGSLLSEKVLQLLLNRIPARKPAALKGYKRHPIRDQIYPAVIPSSPTDTVHGQLLLGITPSELLLLDAFEDPAYDRLLIPITLSPNEIIHARLWARPAGNDDDLLQDQDWDVDRFLREHEDRFLQMCTQWIQEYHHTNSTKP